MLREKMQLQEEAVIISSHWVSKSIFVLVIFSHYYFPDFAPEQSNYMTQADDLKLSLLEQAPATAEMSSTW